LRVEFEKHAPNPQANYLIDQLVRQLERAFSGRRRPPRADDACTGWKRGSGRSRSSALGQKPNPSAPRLPTPMRPIRPLGPISTLSCASAKQSQHDADHHADHGRQACGVRWAPEEVPATGEGTSVLAWRSAASPALSTWTPRRGRPSTASPQPRLGLPPAGLNRTCGRKSVDPAGELRLSGTSAGVLKSAPCATFVSSMLRALRLLVAGAQSMAQAPAPQLTVISDAAWSGSAAFDVSALRSQAQAARLSSVSFGESR